MEESEREETDDDDDDDGDDEEKEPRNDPNFTTKQNAKWPTDDNRIVWPASPSSADREKLGGRVRTTS